MENLNIEKFSPKKAELMLLADKYKSLEIEGIDDVAGFKIVDEARKDLKKKRVEITHTGEDLRKDARAFASKVIEVQKDLIKVIEPLEEELKAKIEKIEEEKAKIERIALLPERREKLKKINITIKDEEILDMSPEYFQEFHSTERIKYLEEKERLLDEKIKKEEEEKKRKEREEQEEIERKANEEKIKKQAKELEEKIKKQAKENEDRLKKQAKELEEKIKQQTKENEEKMEKQKRENEEKLKKQAEELKKQAKESERKRIEEVEKNKQDEEERKAKELKKIEEEKMEIAKDIRFKKWLIDCGVTSENKLDFIRKNDDKGNIVLYKKISIFNLK